MKKIYVSLFLIPFSLTSFAQEESEACVDPSKKVMKMIETAVNAKDARTAVLSFNEAIEADESNATVYYEYGMYAYQSGLDY